MVVAISRAAATTAAPVAVTCDTLMPSSRLVEGSRSMFIDPLYLVIFVVTLVISGASQIYIKSTFGKWSQVANSSGLSGAQVGERLVSRVGFGSATGPATGIKS